MTLTLLVSACGGLSAAPDPEPAEPGLRATAADRRTTVPPVDPERLAAAIDAAVAYMDGAASEQPRALTLMDPFYRWYGIEAFSDAPERYQRAINAAAQPDDAAYLRIFGRLVSVRDIGAEGRGWDEIAPIMLLKGGLNPITVPALYCAQVPLPPGYVNNLGMATRVGGYYVTHVAFALRWLVENGCPIDLPDGFEDRVTETMAAILDEDPRVLDIEVQAAAMLSYMGRSDLVKAEFIELLLGTQRSDGGWYRSRPDRSNWHTTNLALWTLLHIQNPDAMRDPMVPQKCTLEERIKGCQEPKAPGRTGRDAGQRGLVVSDALLPGS